MRVAYQLAEYRTAQVAEVCGHLPSLFEVRHVPSVTRLFTIALLLLAAIRSESSYEWHTFCATTDPQDPITKSFLKSPVLLCRQHFFSSAATTQRDAPVHELEFLSSILRLMVWLSRSMNTSPFFLFIYGLQNTEIEIVATTLCQWNHLTLADNIR